MCHPLGMIPQEFRSLGLHLQSILDSYGLFGCEVCMFCVLPGKLCMEVKETQGYVQLCKTMHRPMNGMM